MDFPILSVIILVPLLGSLVTAFLPAEREKLIKWLAVVVSSISLILTAIVVLGFNADAGVQFIDRFVWSKSIGASYFVGVDGLGLTMLVLATLLSVIAVIASWTIKTKVKAYFALLLLLEVGMLGTFLALDYVLFYIFWELVLLPMYFLIGIWGGERREYAAIKFFIYTLAGSVFLLLAILAVYFKTGAETFDMLAIAAKGIPSGYQHIVFWGFFLGFGVKVPIFPLHTWLPDAHVEAPTAVSVLLAGVLLKMGTYAFVRIILPTTPDAMKTYAVFIAVLGVIGIIYGALNALVQKDLKKMVAYSSVSHMGYVMLGIAVFTVMGVNGAIMQMFSHGLITAMLFLLVGYIYERTHTRDISKMGGLLSKIPKLAGILCFASFASLGLPGLSGFVAEFMVLVGAFPVMPAITIVASTGVVITAGYLLWTLQRVVMGELPEKLSGLTDVTTRELITLVPLIILTLVVGLWPDSVLGFVNHSVTVLVKALG